MNSRFIPLLVFAVWSIVCWRWYVCGIKQQCGASAKATPTAVVPLETPSTDTTTTITPATTATPSGSKVQPALTEDMESAQVVAVDDHVLIHFPYGSTRRIDDDAIDAYLSDLARALQTSGGSVSLIGHTDGIGDAASNKRMSLQRAQHIKASLVKKGVDPNKIKVKGQGESRPIGSNDNPRGRYLNRRVEVRLQP